MPCVDLSLCDLSNFKEITQVMTMTRTEMDNTNLMSMVDDSGILAK